MKVLSVAFMVAASMLLVGAFATAEVGGVPFGDERWLLLHHASSVKGR